AYEAGVKRIFKDSALWIGRAREIAELNGIGELLFRVARVEADVCLGLGDTVGAEAKLDSARRWLTPSRPINIAWFHRARASCALLKNDLGSALHEVQEARRVAEEARFPASQVAAYWFLESIVQYRLRNYTAALELGKRAHATVVPGYRPTYELVMLMYEAHRDAFAEPNAGLDRLRTLFCRMRAERRYGMAHYSTPEMTQLCAMALSNAIEPEFVSEMVRRRRFSAPARAPATWPWPLKIRTLGGFAVEVNGEPLAHSGKAQRKPLDLMKALAARGAKAPSGVRVE